MHTYKISERLWQITHLKGIIRTVYMKDSKLPKLLVSSLTGITNYLTPI